MVVKSILWRSAVISQPISETLLLRSIPHVDRRLVWVARRLLIRHYSVHRLVFNLAGRVKRLVTIISQAPGLIPVAS